MINKLFFFFLFAFTFSANAQFTGGPGDGYASDKKFLLIEGVNSLSDNFHVYPTKLKRLEYITIYDLNSEAILVTDCLGKSVVVEASSKGKFQIPDFLAVGKYQITTISEQFYFSDSIFIYD